MSWNRAWGRDPRLDFFRGLAMLIIFVSHVMDNWLAEFIPGRFGPSDAAEMFVFISGYAAAIAFGGTFRRFGFWIGVARVLHRCWQIYWAQLCMIFLCSGIFIGSAWLFENPDYILQSSIRPLLVEHTGEALVGLFSLTFIPYVYDILPMYIAALLLMPIVLLLHRVHRFAAFGFCVCLYLATWLLNLELPAEPWSDRPWFFNPFAWQLLFYTGFAISAGWLRGPKPNLWLITAAASVVVGFIPLVFWGFRPLFPELGTLYRQIIFADGYAPAFLTGQFKTDLHPVRILHFLCLAYLATCLLWRREQVLLGRWAAPIVKVGQQALSTFMASIVLSRLGRVLLDELGRTGWTIAFVNIAGVFGLIVVAYTAAWYKAAPWMKPAVRPAPTPVPAQVAGGGPRMAPVSGSPAMAGP